ncbi:MAG: hypothetical protein U1A27_11030 [Phycisphaerae bacterium]
MSDERFQALLRDRALGVLEADVAALVDAWVAEHPAAAERLAEYSTALGLARRALAGRDEPRTRLPDFPGERIARRAQWQRRWSHVRVLAAAACVGLAFLLGRGSRAGAPVVESHIVQAEPSRAATGIWSRSTWRGSAPERMETSPPAVHWVSPLRIARKEVMS